ncbi:endonuclease [Chamaesiphon polymorphus]|uniref:Endonuclease n=1 Tax=Chamaesiphon polymorphus CCALA 037 TaxID=2107692 RepID=A0A2T1GKZ4_9CYAN|nr:endonuclease [Chamaesiphon polymorphus]PSB58524.1 endonuclease [Chamaesiphon polymorphus CCALA 037]
MATGYLQLNTQQKQAILVAFQSGEECRSIPKILGVSGRSVARVLAEFGVNTKRRNRYTLNESYFDKIDTRIKAYLLGLMAADGCVTSKNYVVLESVDRELVELFARAIEYSGEIREIDRSPHQPHFWINFSSQRLARSLHQWQIITDRMASDSYRFPTAEYLNPYVLGYFDGDGCAYPNKGRSGGLLCIVGSKNFAEELCQVMNMGVTIAHSHNVVYYWRIYSKTNIQKFYDLMYEDPNLGLARKKEKIEQILGSYHRG